MSSAEPAQVKTAAVLPSLTPSIRQAGHSRAVQEVPLETAEDDAGTLRFMNQMPCGLEGAPIVSLEVHRK